MRLFSDSAAQYFCAKPIIGYQLDEDLNVVVNRFGSRRLVEGSNEFEQYRQNLLRSSERAYYLSVSNYRRAHTLMAPSSASWAYVTLYYASWFAAHVICGCFGGWIGKQRFVEVIADRPGGQALRPSPNPRNIGGPHQAFWRRFYGAVNPLKAVVDPMWYPALDPVSGNDTWQIETRNRVNYIVSEARALQAAHQATYDPANFPASLSGDLATQYEITRSMIGAAAQFLRDMAIATDAFHPRRQAVLEEVWTIAPVDAVVATDPATLVV